MTGWKKIAICSCMVIGLIGARSTPAAAQELEPGQNYVHAFIAGMTDGLGAGIGGGFDRAVRERWLVSTDISYMTVGVGSSGVAFNVNGHYLFPLPDSPEFTPYLLGGIGITHVSVSVFGDTIVGLNLGGGVRWQASERWGVRPELKFQIADGSHARFSIGMYYAFGNP